MLKLKYLVEIFGLARFALEYWRHDEESLPDRLKWFRISSNAVYPFEREGKLCFLRLSPVEEKQGSELLGEIDFLQYLNRSGYPAMRPITAENGDMLLLLDTPWGRWYASAFEGVGGCQLEDIPMTEALAEAYGAALGQLHGASMHYQTPIRRRNEQDVLEWVRQVFEAQHVAENLLTVLHNTAQSLVDRSRTTACYGLIHYDFEPDNVFWDGEKCSVIDFEDGMLHFYTADMVQALDELPEMYHAAFLRGYRAACPDAEVHVQDFPLMRRFRDLYSTARLLHCLSEKPVPEPEWMPQLTAKLEYRLQELMEGLGRCE